MSSKQIICPAPGYTTQSVYLSQTINDRQNVKCVHIHSLTRTLYWWYRLEFRSGLLILFSSFKRCLVHTTPFILFFYKQPKFKIYFYFRETEDTPGFLHTLVITTVKSGTEQPTLAGRHTVTESNNTLIR